jgi:hypothetical protein
MLRIENLHLKFLLVSGRQCLTGASCCEVAFSLAGAHDFAYQPTLEYKKSGSLAAFLLFARAVN